MINLDTIFIFLFVFSMTMVSRLIIILIISLFNDNPSKIMNNRDIIFYVLYFSYIITFLIKH